MLEQMVVHKIENGWRQGALRCLPYFKLFYSALQLLKFQKNESNPQAGHPLSNQPDLKMHFKYVEKAVRHGPTKHYSHPRADVSYVGTCYYLVLVSLLLSSLAVLIVYLCFQDNTPALLLWSWCFRSRSYHSFTKPTASVQKEHQIRFRTYERCKNMYSTGEYKLYLCLQKFILGNALYDGEICTEWRTFRSMIVTRIYCTVSPVCPIGYSTHVRMVVSPYPQCLKILTSLRFMFKVLWISWRANIVTCL